MIVVRCTTSRFTVLGLFPIAETREMLTVVVLGSYVAIYVGVVGTRNTTWNNSTNYISSPSSFTFFFSFSHLSLRSMVCLYRSQLPAPVVCVFASPRPSAPPPRQVQQTPPRAPLGASRWLQFAVQVVNWMACAWVHDKNTCLLFPLVLLPPLLLRRFEEVFTGFQLQIDLGTHVGGEHLFGPSNITTNTHLPWELGRRKRRVRFLLRLGGLDGLQTGGRTFHIFGLEPFILACRLLRRLEVLTTELGQEAVPRFICKFRVLGQFTPDHQFLSNRVRTIQ
jgi:hypothetical protein